MMRGEDIAGGRRGPKPLVLLSRLRWDGRAPGNAGASAVLGGGGGVPHWTAGEVVSTIRTRH